jgi:hypothetical protein
LPLPRDAKIPAKKRAAKKKKAKIFFGSTSSMTMVKTPQGQVYNQSERRLKSLGVATGKVEIFLGSLKGLAFRSLWNVGIIQPKTLYFTTDKGPVAFIEIQYIRQILIARLPNKGMHEMFAEVLPIMVIEIHRQKGDVCRHIRIAEPLIKFDAIKNGNLILPEDMLQSEVSMTIFNSIGINPLVKYFLLCSKKIVRPILHLFISFS